MICKVAQMTLDEAFTLFMRFGPRIHEQIIYHVEGGSGPSDGHGREGGCVVSSGSWE